MKSSIFLFLILGSLSTVSAMEEDAAFKKKLQRLITQERKRKCDTLKEAWYFWQLTSQKNPQEEKKALIAVTACQMPYDDLLKKVNEL